jgi:hypothetical protein
MATKKPVSKVRLKNLAAKYAAAKRAADEAAAVAEELRAKLVALMTEADISKSDVELEDGTVVTNTLVEPVSTNVDIDLLRDLVSRSTFDRVTKQSVDMTAFHASVSSGDISMEVVNKVVTTVERTPYIRTSVR